MNKYARLFRPTASTDMPQHCIALHDEKTNIVFYNKEVFDTLTEGQKNYMFRVKTSFLTFANLPPV